MPAPIPKTIKNILILFFIENHLLWAKVGGKVNVCLKDVTIDFDLTPFFVFFEGSAGR